MKTILKLSALFVFACAAELNAQNVSTRTNEFEVDFSDPKMLVNSTVPFITWITPTAESSYSGETKYKIKFQVESVTPLKEISVALKDTPEASSRSTQKITPATDADKLKSIIERTITLMEGQNVIEIIAQNADGIKTYSQRIVNIGTNVVAEVNKLNRTDYALIFTTNDYDHWPDLTNPVKDGRMIADELRKNYGFNVEVMEGGSQADILKKLRTYAEKKYKPLDQLFIFFAGHGRALP